MDKKRLWVCPNNDLEANEIIKMLKENNEEYLITGQEWGAAWDKLESDIKEKIEQAKSEGKEIYGIELQGKLEGMINIDHHIYGDDDRSNSDSSIEQVGKILKVDLNLDQKFVAANDKGYIPEMENLGKELNLPKNELEKTIADIRMRDRKMQGVTTEQETQAQEAVEKLGKIEEKRNYIQLDLPHSKSSTVTDRLYGKYNNLLITSDDGEVNFFGTTDIIKILNEKFPDGWSGGQLDKGSGFWGGYPNKESIKETVAETIKIQMKKELEEKENKLKEAQELEQKYNELEKNIQQIDKKNDKSESSKE